MPPLARRGLLVAAGIALLAASAAMACEPKDAAVVLPALALACLGFVGLLVALGRPSKRPRLGRPELLGCLLLGLVARLLLVPAEPVLEDDVNRYLWDGAVLASGTSPYAYSPQEVFNQRHRRPQPQFSASQLAELDALADLSSRSDIAAAFAGINYPSVPTIYPPLSQGLFAALSLFFAGSVVAMKLLLLVFELIIAGALVVILKRTQTAVGFVLLYWWNPVIILSFAGSAHMDAVPMALLCVAVALALRRAAVFAGVALGLAAAAKLFPLVVLPALWHRLGWRAGLAALATAGASYAILWHPRMFEGLRTFAESWQINGAFHPALAALINDHAARFAGGIAVLITAVVVARRELVASASWALATLVLWSPAINPWYIAWLVPFATARRSLPLLALSMTVLLSYVRFLGSEIPSWLPWIEFGVPLVVLAAVAHRARKAPQPAEFSPAREKM